MIYREQRNNQGVVRLIPGDDEARNFFAGQRSGSPYQGESSGDSFANSGVTLTPGKVRYPLFTVDWISVFVWAFLTSPFWGAFVYGMYAGLTGPQH